MPDVRFNKSNKSKPASNWPLFYIIFSLFFLSFSALNAIQPLCPHPAPIQLYFTIFHSSPTVSGINAVPNSKPLIEQHSSKQLGCFVIPYIRTDNVMVLMVSHTQCDSHLRAIPFFALQFILYYIGFSEPVINPEPDPKGCTYMIMFLQFHLILFMLYKSSRKKKQ